MNKFFLLFIFSVYLPLASATDHVKFSGNNVVGSDENLFALHDIIDVLAQKNIEKEKDLILEYDHITHIDHGITAPHLAAAIGHLDIVTSFLKPGVEMDVQDYYGKTPLHYAAENDRTTTVKMLLENGADINIKDVKNLKPLDYFRSKNKYKNKNTILSKLAAKQAACAATF